MAYGTMPNRYPVCPPRERLTVFRHTSVSGMSQQTPSAQYIDYLSQDVKPLYSFYYGLSYTKFS
ncbi:MAG: hypothetical protein IH593_06415 [Bacteroidales bacterium]|nr:hypothetical protein [Bacteroidales bacterium]